MITCAYLRGWSTRGVQGPWLKIYTVSVSGTYLGKVGGRSDGNMHASLNNCMHASLNNVV